MHKNHLEAVQLTQKTAWGLTSDDTEAVEVVVCPPFTALRSVGTLIEGDRLAFRLGAPNCHPEPEVAYEPVWAIGTGRAATPGDAQETIALIRQTIAELVGPPAAETIRIQYGGSLDADEFALIVKGAGRRRTR